MVGRPPECAVAGRRGGAPRCVWRAARPAGGRRSPERMLGERRSSARFGPRLPFLLKVLAAARPLSLQTHPTLAQARAGYAREEAAAVPRGRPAHLQGPQPQARAAGGAHPVRRARRVPRPGGDRRAVRRARRRRCRRGCGRGARLQRHGLADTFWALWDLDAAGREALVAARPGRGHGVAAGRGPWCAPRPPGRRASPAEHPTDAGVVVALLLNLLRLEPGQAMFVPAGRLHAYLHGVGIEVMASSDNVVRGGLTAKHVDLAELAAVLDVRAEQIEPLAGTAGPGGLDYPTPAPEFAVTRLAPADRRSGRRHPSGTGDPPLHRRARRASTGSRSSGGRRCSSRRPPVPTRSRVRPPSGGPRSVVVGQTPESPVA